MRIVVAGGTGFLGSALVDRLRSDGHSVAVLTRNQHGPQHVRWDPYGSFQSWAHVLDDAGAVINLVGAAISKRWTAAHKREMWSSRVRVTKTLVAAMKSVPRMPATLINASAVGIYGDRGDELITEESAPGSGFLASLGREWEREAMAARPHARVVLLRSGIVLDDGGGALPKMALPFRLFAGGPLGSGRQFLSWIHREDWTAMACWALTADSLSGPLNVTAPNPTPNLEFARRLGRILHRPALMPAPAFALRLALGEMADALVTGQRVIPAKARELGFEFQHPLLEGALRAIYNRAA